MTKQACTGTLRAFRSEPNSKASEATAMAKRDEEWKHRRRGERKKKGRQTKTKNKFFKYLQIASTIDTD